ncbi:hypothetical protein M3Y97_00655100 [Aphelenchoides bicaudatus]|nr:hypothetical protein M3Y97_00655100 [Aphelenchoides bicaudatus]
MFNRRRATEATVFVTFIVGIHYMYYKIQSNESLVPKNERQELFYIKWLKDRIPALKGVGIQD